MIKAEAKRKDKIDFILIVTPNNTHFPIAKLGLENGLHVVCFWLSLMNSIALELNKELRF